MIYVQILFYNSYRDNDDDDNEEWNFGTVKTQPAFNNDTVAPTAEMHNLSLAQKKQVSLHYDY